MMELLGALLALLLARRRRRRRWNPNNQVVRIASAVALLTLADVTALIAPVVGASDNEYRALSVTLTWSLRDGTATEGPISVGVAHGDYTATEVEEWIESTASITRGDLVTREASERLIRQVGTFSGASAEETLNDGKPIRTKLNWVVASGDTISLWAYNQSGAALTTGAEIAVLGKIFLRWL